MASIAAPRTVARTEVGSALASASFEIISRTPTDGGSVTAPPKQQPPHEKQPPEPPAAPKHM